MDDDWGSSISGKLQKSQGYLDIFPNEEVEVSDIHILHEISLKISVQELPKSSPNSEELAQRLASVKQRPGGSVRCFFVFGAVPKTDQDFTKMFLSKNTIQYQIPSHCIRPDLTAKL